MIEKNAVIFIRAPSQTSQTQKCEGEAPSLKNKAIRNKQRPKNDK